MGNDIEVFERENDEFDQIFWRNHGPTDESTYSFFRRGYNEFCDRLSVPQRSAYTSDDLIRSGYEAREFNLQSHRGNTLHCCSWRNLNPSPVIYTNPICILYLHTNTRNLSDATEVISLCDRLGANLVSFDLEGISMLLRSI